MFKSFIKLIVIKKYNYERFLSPLKIIDLEIPIYIVPIKPQWAEQLFNDKSKFCILPKKLKEVEIEPKEYQKALEVVEKYNVQQNNEMENNKEKDIVNENYNSMKKILNKY